MSLYADYLSERQDVQHIEFDGGFANFRKLDADTYYFVDIFVVKEKRKTTLASEIIKRVCQLAKDDGAKKIIGSIDLSANGVTNSMRLLIGNKMEFSHYNGTMLYFVKML